MRRARSKDPAQLAQARKRRRWLIGTALLLILGGGAYFGGQQLWAQHQLHQAQQSLHDGDYPLAIAKLQKCQETWPNDPQTHLLLARANRLAGHHAEALKQLQACKENGGDPASVELESQ